MVLGLILSSSASLGCGSSLEVGGLPSALEKAEEDNRAPPSEPSMAPPDVWKGGSWAIGTQSQLESHPTAPLCSNVILGLGSGAPGSCCLQHLLPLLLSPQ